MSDSVFSEDYQFKRLLEGLETGELSAADSYNIAKELDPVLLFFVFHFLRENYKAGHPQQLGVSERLVELSSTYPDLVANAKKGSQDSLAEWFEDELSVSEFRDDSQRFAGVILDKFNS